MFDDLTPEDVVVECLHSGVHHTFWVHFDHLVPHHHLSQAHFITLFYHDREIFGICLCETETVSGAFKHKMQFAVG